MCECGVDGLTDMLRRVAARNRSGRSMCECGVDELTDMLRRVAERNRSGRSCVRVRGRRTY